MNTTVLLVLSTVLLYLLKVYIDYRSAVKAIQYEFLAMCAACHLTVSYSHRSSNHPGSRTVISSFGLFAFPFKKPIRGLVRGSFRTWLRKHLDYEEHGVDIISAVRTSPTFRGGDMLKHMLQDRRCAFCINSTRCPMLLRSRYHTAANPFTTPLIWP